MKIYNLIILFISIFLQNNIFASEHDLCSSSAFDSTTINMTISQFTGVHTDEVECEMPDGSSEEEDYELDDNLQLGLAVQGEKANKKTLSSCSATLKNYIKNLNTPKKIFLALFFLASYFYKRDKIKALVVAIINYIKIRKLDCVLVTILSGAVYKHIFIDSRSVNKPKVYNALYRQLGTSSDLLCLDHIDSFSKNSFRDLILQSEQKNIPFILARIKYLKKNIENIQAKGFHLLINKDNQDDDATFSISDLDYPKLFNCIGRQGVSIETINYFTISSLSDEHFTYIGNYLDFDDRSKNKERLLQYFVSCMALQEIDKYLQIQEAEIAKALCECEKKLGEYLNNQTTKSEKFILCKPHDVLVLRIISKNPKYTLHANYILARIEFVKQFVDLDSKIEDKENRIKQLLALKKRLNI